MTTDAQLRKDVEAELALTPDVESREIVVGVSAGVVTLTGYVPAAYDKAQAELATLRVAGVHGVANDICVREAKGRLDDPEIARRAVEAIAQDLPAVAPRVQVIVRDAHVTLEGAVDWFWQRQRIESAVRAIQGIDVVTNLLVVVATGSGAEIQPATEGASDRHTYI